ncbi:MAG: tetratricopeptide repeat protein [Chloroflexota bacterium]
MTTPNSFTIDAASLRQVLNQWDNVPAMGSHPLAALQLVTVQRQKGGYPDTLEERGRALCAVIRDAIQTFPQPNDDDLIPAKPTRSYVILTEQFIKKRKPDYVADMIGLARRTYYDEQSRALDMLVEVLEQREKSAFLAPSPDSLSFIATPTLSKITHNFSELPLSIIPQPAPLPIGSVMPLERNPLFVGREADFLTLASALKGGDTVAIGQIETAATTGVGGIGKTQLASEFVHRYGQYFGGGVFWLSFAEAKAVPAEIAACGGLGRMNLRPNFADLSLEDQINLVTAAWQEPVPRLLVFDNCEEPDLLQQWRPTSGGCRILVTSRRATWDPVLGIQSIPLDVLSRKESLALLQEHCPDADVAILEAIADELGDLPLALHVAGSFMATYKRAVTPEQYLAQLQSPALLEHLSFDGIGPSPTRHVQNLYRTMTLSYDKLDPKSPIDQVAQQLLASAVCLAPGEPIPRDLLICTLQLPENDFKAAIQAEDALKRLLELGLIIPATEEAVRLHRLVVAFVQDVVPTINAVRRTTEDALLAEVHRINELGRPTALETWHRHLQTLTKNALTRGGDIGASLGSSMARHLAQAGDYSTGLLYLEQTLAIHEQCYGTNHPITARSLANLGYHFHRSKDLDKAETCFAQALQVQLIHLGEDHPDTARTLNYMGYLKQNNGDLLEAHIIHKRALRIRKKVFEDNHMDIAQSLINLAFIDYTNQEWASAEKNLLQAKKIYSQLVREDHPKMISVLEHLGELAQAQQKFDEALDTFYQVLSLRKRVLSEIHPETARTLENLGEVYYAQGELLKSEDYHNQALAIRLDTLGDDHKLTARSWQHLGVLQQDFGKFDVAREYYEKALFILEKTLGFKHKSTQAVYQNLHLLNEHLQATEIELV